MEQLEQYIRILFISKLVESMLLIILIGLVFYLVYLIKNENRITANALPLKNDKISDFADFDIPDSKTHISAPKKTLFKKFNQPKNSTSPYSNFVNDLINNVETFSPNFIVFSRRENSYVVLFCFGKGKKIEQCLACIEIEGTADISLILATLDTFTKSKKIKVNIDFDFFEKGL